MDITNNNIKNNYKYFQLFTLVALRIFIGWHFLYEGIVKVLNSNWSSLGYLLDSQGFFSEFYLSLAASPATVGVVDFLNKWGLIAIGLGLILGLYTKIASVGGITLLGLYYISHIPIYNLRYIIPVEGSYLLVNKTLIELVALGVILAFPTGNLVGIDRIRYLFTHKKSSLHN